MDIFIAPIKFSNNTLLNNVLQELSGLFNQNVLKINLDIKIENAQSKERYQYHSTQLIANTIELTNTLNGKVILLTDLDLYVPVLTFVFGEAQLNGKHSIVSVCRLHEEFYSGKSDDKLLLQRTMKEILHELGHNFGLIHCTDWDCVMHSSLGIEEVDIKGGGFCKSCASNVEGYKHFISPHINW